MTLRLWLSCLALLIWPAAASADEQLIVFTQPDVSELAETFDLEHLPQILALAEEMGVEVKTIDAANGVPEGVGITPLIVYQNHRGRSVYQGRYTTLDRLRNHVRTSRVMPQSDALLQRNDTPVWTMANSKVAAPIKVTPLKGAVPDGFDPEAFQAEARAAITRGLAHFEPTGAVGLGRSDRMFYVDFYPYVADDGTLYIGTALFSQFHCHDPIFIRTDQPVSGPWADRDAVFTKAAAELDEQIVAHIEGSAIGDGFDPIPARVVTKSYEELGLPLPPKPAGRTVDVDLAGITLSSSWVVDDAANADQPAVQFRFPAPLELYSGEAPDLTGRIDLNDQLDADSATGAFHVAVDTVTMGESDLDAHIRSSGMLDAAGHPTSTFRFEQVNAEPGPIAFGLIKPITLTGTFTMKGMAIPLEVPGQLEAFIGEDVRPRLLLTATWRIPIANPFGLEGPEGPDEAKDHLIFNANITLKPEGLEDGGLEL